MRQPGRGPGQHHQSHPNDICARCEMSVGANAGRKKAQAELALNRSVPPLLGQRPQSMYLISDSLMSDLLSFSTRCNASGPHRCLSVAGCFQLSVWLEVDRWLAVRFCPPEFRFSKVTNVI